MDKREMVNKLREIADALEYGDTKLGSIGKVIRKDEDDYSVKISRTNILDSDQRGSDFSDNSDFLDDALEMFGSSIQEIKKSRDTLNITYKSEEVDEIDTIIFNGVTFRKY